MKKNVNNDVGCYKNGEWEMGNKHGKLNLFTLPFDTVELFLSAAFIDIHVFFLATLCTRIKGPDNGISLPELFLYFTT